MYIEQTLSKDEEILKVFYLHNIFNFIHKINCVLCLFTLGIWVFFTIVFWLSYKSVEQAVTNSRVILKHGIIARRTKEMMLDAVESVSIKQGILGRILGFGTVIVSGRGEGVVNLAFVENPLLVKKTIESYCSKCYQQESTTPQYKEPISIR